MLRQSTTLWAVAAAALAIFTPTVWSSFAGDDFPQILHNPQLNSWSYLPRLIATNVWSQRPNDSLIVQYYRPVFSLWLLAWNQLFRPEAWLWHISSIALHVAATLLVIRIELVILGVGKPSGWIAAAAAGLLFAVHPIHVEAVSWISASPELLYVVFGLASLLAWRRAFITSKPTWTVASVLIFCLSLGAKETALVFLPVMLLWQWYWQRGSTEKPISMAQRLAGIAPFLAAAGGYLAVRFVVLNGNPGAVEHSWAEVLWSAPRVSGVYLRQLVLPWNVSSFYVTPGEQGPSVAWALGMLVGGTAVALAVWLVVKRRDPLGLGMSMVVLPLAFSTLAIRVYHDTNMVHDRYLYCSTVGLSIVVAVLGQRYAAQGWRRWVAIAGVLSISGWWAFQTVEAQTIYHDDRSYYRRAVDLYPNEPHYRVKLGKSLLADRSEDEAVEQLQIASGLAPQNENLRWELARGLFAAQRFGEAETVLREVVDARSTRDRDRQSGLLALGDTQIQLGKLRDAEGTLKRLIELNAKYAGAHRTLGSLYQREGRLRAAQLELEAEFMSTGDVEALKMAKKIGRYLGQSTGTPPEGKLLR